VRDGCVLMSRRRPDQSFAHHWEFPGGKVEPGETPEHALRREIEEELGCTVRVGGIYDVVSHAYDRFDLLMLVYRCSLEDGEPIARQVAEVAWVNPSDIPGLNLPPADYPLARRLAAELDGGRRGPRLGLESGQS
jgi:8-oxo-dGTP diphosphatase